MVMDELDRMTKEAVQSPEEAAQLVGLEPEGELTFQPTAVQVNAESKVLTVYHTVTGEPRTMPLVYARTAVLKRFRAKDGPGLAGKFVFTPRKEDAPEYKLGSVTCLLHPSRPERAVYDTWGLPVCMSAHLPSEYEAERHTENDHTSAWDRMKEMKQRRREDEDRERQSESLRIQNQILQGLANNMAPQPVATTASTGEVTTWTETSASEVQEVTVTSSSTDAVSDHSASTSAIKAHG